MTAHQSQPWQQISMKQHQQQQNNTTTTNKKMKPICIYEIVFEIIVEEMR